MKSSAEKMQEQKRKPASYRESDKKPKPEPSKFSDHRPESATQMRLQELADNSSQAIQMKRWQEMSDQKANIKATGINEKLQPAPTSSSLPIQAKSDGTGSGIVQRNGYGKLEKESEEAMWHKNFGKQLVGTFRLIDQASIALGQGKNREAMKSCAIGLAKAGISVATMVSGIPGLVGMESGAVTSSLTAESMGQQAGSTGGGLALGAAESVPVEGQNRKVQETTTGGAIAAKIHDKVGTLSNAANTLLGFVPFFAPAKQVAKGVKLAVQSKDDFNRNKGKIARSIQEVLNAMDAAISEVDFKNFGDVTVTTANSKNIFAHTKRSLNDIWAKFQKKAEKLENIISTWEDKHEDVMPLLGGRSSAGNEEDL